MIEKWWNSYFNGPFYLLIYFNTGEFILKLTPDENSNYCIGFTIKQCILTWDVSIILHVFSLTQELTNRKKMTLLNELIDFYVCTYVKIACM